MAGSSAMVGSELFDEPTGWPRVDREIGGIRAALRTARTEEDFQAVGLRCREVLISLAQAVFKPGVHRTTDKVKTSQSDVKRMLEAYLVTEHPGPGNKVARRLVTAAFDLANRVQHHRKAEFRDAALCAEGAITAIHTVAILAGRRDDSPREETAVQIAQRRQREDERRRQKDVWLRMPESLTAMVEQFGTITRHWTARVEEMKGALGFRSRKVNDEVLVESLRAGLAAGLHLRGRSAYEGQLAISEYDGYLTVGGFFPEDQKAKRLATWRYAFDRDDADTMGWRDTESGCFYTSEQLAEHHLKRLVKQPGDA